MRWSLRRFIAETAEGLARAAEKQERAGQAADRKPSAAAGT
jgi:hypothetical protein